MLGVWNIFNLNAGWLNEGAQGKSLCLYRETEMNNNWFTVVSVRTAKIGQLVQCWGSHILCDNIVVNAQMYFQYAYDLTYSQAVVKNKMAATWFLVFTQNLTNGHHSIPLRLNMNCLFHSFDSYQCRCVFISFLHIFCDGLFVMFWCSFIRAHFDWQHLLIIHQRETRLIFTDIFHTKMSNFFI